MLKREINPIQLLCNYISVPEINKDESKKKTETWKVQEKSNTTIFGVYSETNIFGLCNNANIFGIKFNKLHHVNKTAQKGLDNHKVISK